MTTTKIIENLVLSGGSLKGLAYCGVFKLFNELHSIENVNIKLDIKKIISVSAGSVAGLMYVLGYRYEEIYEELFCKNFSDLKDLKISEFFKSYGLDSGNNIMTWIETLLLKKNFKKNITFKELYLKTDINFGILATNLSKRKNILFNHINNPDMVISRAIRLSINIPLLFTIQYHENDIYIDGGIMSNYPIHLIDDSELKHTLGIKIISNTSKTMSKIVDLYSYILNVVQCFLSSRDKFKPDDHTMIVETGDLKTSFDFTMNNSVKETFVSDGYKCAKKYFDKFTL